MSTTVTSALPRGVVTLSWRWTIVAGVVLGAVYTLSPLTVWFAAGAVLAWRLLVRDLDAGERQVLTAIFLAALLLRLVVVVVLFLSVDHAATPFGSLFGDEEYFKRRSLWLRSLALDVNISEADRRYATDEYSETSYLYLLALIQIIVGDAPYGLHLFSILTYLAAAVWFYRYLRGVFGPAPAMLSFAAILFLPTLFFWSVSALRESIHFLLTLAAIVGMTLVLQLKSAKRTVSGLAMVVVALAALLDLRAGSAAVVGVALLTGSAAAAVMTSWRRLIVAGVIALAVIGVALTQPAVQQRLMASLRDSAMYHQGHAWTWTTGVHYKLLEPRFYRERIAGIMDDMTAAEAGRYVARALVAAVVVPLPQHAGTRLIQAYMPEHVLWLVMVALLPLGIYAGIRRHPAATLIMASYVAVMFVGIALRSGNVGTLVRHRGLIVPFVVCLSAVAACHLLARWSRKSVSPERIA